MRLSVMCLLLAFVSCNTKVSQEQKEKGAVAISLESVGQKKVLPRDSVLTGFAKFIACMELDPILFKNSSTRFESDLKRKFGGMVNYSSEKWDRLHSRVGSPIGSWVANQPYSSKIEPNVLLYPFAGGDFYYGHLFNPNQDTIIMLGLEAPGTLFRLSEFEPDTIAAYLSGLEKSMFFPHQLGFFRTKSMADDFKTTLLNGTIHTALYYMGRMGYEIHYIKGIDIGETLELNSELNNKCEGVRVGYSKAGESDPIREWIYISQDISDGGLKTKKGQIVKRYLESKGNVVCFFKAASYLLHNDYFSQIRNLCLKQSQRILQDDSGIPYAVLKQNGFKVHLMGVYHRTIPLFSDYLQEDLKDSYSNKNPANLPFNIGYNATFHECNLQLATRP